MNFSYIYLHKDEKNNSENFDLEGLEDKMVTGSYFPL